MHKKRTRCQIIYENKLCVKFDQISILYTLVNNESLNEMCHQRIEGCGWLSGHEPKDFKRFCMVAPTKFANSSCTNPLTSLVIRLEYLLEISL